MKARAVAIACALDLAAGDPAWFPHPVRGFGFAAHHGERLALRLARGDARQERVYGTIMSCTIVAGTYALAAIALDRTRARDPRAADALEIVLAWTTISIRDLLSEALAVDRALDSGTIVEARARVARIVGRDTHALDESEVARATIETLAESTCDGIAAPLLALVAGGVPLALAFKAASTLDSTIGHREAPHADAGFFAAKLDDVLCFVPARMTALALSLAARAGGGRSRRALATWRRDGARHASPNAGQPEAAIAGALGVRLGGSNAYAGVLHAGPPLGGAFAAPHPRDIARARAVVAAASAVIAMAAIALRRARE